MDILPTYYQFLALDPPKQLARIYQLLSAGVSLSYSLVGTDEWENKETIATIDGILLCDENLHRRNVIVTNLSDDLPIRISKTLETSPTGWLLKAGQSQSFETTTPIYAWVDGEGTTAKVATLEFWFLAEEE